MSQHYGKMIIHNANPSDHEFFKFYQNLFVTEEKSDLDSLQEFKQAFFELLRKKQRVKHLER